MGGPDERLSTIPIDTAARERVARALSHHSAEDHIGTDELETRLARVHAATTAAELDAVVADLPATAAEATAALVMPLVSVSHWCYTSAGGRGNANSQEAD